MLCVCALICFEFGVDCWGHWDRTVCYWNRDTHYEDFQVRQEVPRVYTMTSMHINDLSSSRKDIGYLQRSDLCYKLRKGVFDGKH